MILNIAGRRASELGLPFQIEVRDVPVADAPLALQGHTFWSGHRVPFALHWHRGQLWRDTEFSTYDEITRLLIAAKDASVLADIRRVAAGLIGIDGVAFAPAAEPYWHFRVPTSGERSQSGAGATNHTILTIGWSTLGADGHPEMPSPCRRVFRIDRLAEAKAYGDAAFKRDRFSIGGACEVLLPEALRLDPERAWLGTAFDDLIGFIRAGADDAPPLEDGVIAEGVASAVVEGLRQLGQERHWSGHTMLRLFAALGKELGVQVGGATGRIT